MHIVKVKNNGEWENVGSVTNADNINCGILAIDYGGTSSNDGATGLANLFAAGATVLSSYQYGDTLPDPGIPGRIFFVKKMVSE